jgi:hypothetical protein
MDWDYWRFGFDLDGVDTTSSAQRGCTPPRVDGCNGIDNAFGESVLPYMIGSWRPDENRSATTETTAAIEVGTWTLMFRFENLGTAPDQTGVAGAVLTGAPREAAPVWDGSDVWPVTWDSVHDGDLQRPRTSPEESYVSSGRWVARFDELPFALRGDGVWVPLPLRHAIVALDITGVGSAASGTNGVIAGVLNPERMLEARAPQPGCGWGAYLGWMVEASFDVLPDLSRDPEATCTAISFGIGFEARPVVVGEVAPATRRSPKLCP